MEETKLEIPEPRHKAISAHVKCILRMRKGLFADPESLDIRGQFSDYVIHHIICGERGIANSLKGDPDHVLGFCHTLYLQYMQVFEEEYNEGK